MITPYVTISGRPEFERNKTGFGYMVYGIARAVGVTETVDVLATDSRGSAFTIEGVQYLKRSLWLFIKNIFHAASPSRVLALFRKYPLSGGSSIRLWYYWTMTGYLNDLLKTEQYDIVHIHGCGFSTELWMQVCKKRKQKFIVTLHGLNSFSETVKLEIAGKQYERDFLKRVVDGEFPITVISTGMKHLIQKTYNAGDCKNIIVVCNSFYLNDTEEVERVDIRKQYGIPNYAKIVLYVGNIGRNKNQGQLVRAFNLLPNELANRTYVLFLGSNQEVDYKIIDFAKQTSYSEHFITCGFISKDLVSQYYEQGNGVALLSQSEGFGLSLIEGMYFGLPCMMFKDMDAFEDIYDECAVVPIKDRTDQSVSDAVIHLLKNEWDKDAIRQYSRKFQSDVMANKYIKVYQTIV